MRKLLVGALALFGSIAGAVVGWLLLAPVDGRPDILLITVDTLRADALGPYDAERSTPGILAFAADAVVYERAVTPIPLTRPAISSLMSGRHPRSHGVLNNEIALPEEFSTVAQSLASSGYATGGFVGTRLLGRGSGLGRGFTNYDVPRRRVHVRADWVVKRALRWLGQQSEQPVFVWVHLFDPHQPYDPPKRFRERLDPTLSAQLPSGRWETLEQVARANDGAISESMLDHVRQLYQAEVRYMDTWVARLLEGSAERARPSLVVLTADHGECFENGVYFEHSDCLYRGATRVPLLVRYPAGSPRRASEPVDLLDVGPTLLNAAGVEVPEAWPGRPLQGGGRTEHTTLLQHPLFEAGRRPFRDRVIRSVAGDPVKEAQYGHHPVGLVGALWKYLRLPDGDELYRVGDESRNQATERSDVVEEMGHDLDQWVAEMPLRVVEAEALNLELRETLEALGYLH